MRRRTRRKIRGRATGTLAEVMKNRRPRHPRRRLAVRRLSMSVAVISAVRVVVQTGKEETRSKPVHSLRSSLSMVQVTSSRLLQRAQGAVAHQRRMLAHSHQGLGSYLDGLG